MGKYIEIQQDKKNNFSIMGFNKGAHHFVKKLQEGMGHINL
jgi:hypothetical protein